MKRQSIAEQTLAKQLNNIAEQITLRNRHIESLQVGVNELHNMARTIQAEIDRLQQARLKASERVNP